MSTPPALTGQIALIPPFPKQPWLSVVASLNYRDDLPDIGKILQLSIYDTTLM